VDNDELRDALKENGIGRPSTRAAIIETLFKRNYIRKERKNLYPTATGAELIGTIHEELLKSAELTGLWEKKLRQIERGTYEARTFLDELKQMVNEVVGERLRLRIRLKQLKKLPKTNPRRKRKRNLVSLVPRKRKQRLLPNWSFHQRISPFAPSVTKALSSGAKPLMAALNTRMDVRSAWITLRMEII
jgi:DNA topoisomerase-3